MVKLEVYLKLFDNKLADTTYKLSGEEPSTWKKKTEGYFISQCPPLLPVLEHLETRKDPVTPDNDMMAVVSRLSDFGYDPGRISELIWGF